MNEARPYASLSSGLLARKGSAKPAMRPQAYGSMEDLGWNDMGYGPGEQPAAPVVPEHVPSSIAALTPAPKIQGTRTAAGYVADEPDGDEEYCEAEAIDPDFAPEQEAEAEPFEAAVEPALPEVEEPIHDEAAFEPPVAFEASAPVEEVEAPSVVAQQRAILERFDGELEAAPAGPRRAARAEVVPLPKRQNGAAGRKAAFTLRLDGDRHLRLRLACAVTGRSAQQIVARALDEALACIPEIEALASQVPAKAGRAGVKA